MQMRWRVPESALVTIHAAAMNTSPSPRPIFLLLLVVALIALGAVVFREIAVDPSAYRVALSLEKRGLYKFARPLYLHAAQQGDAQAQVRLAGLYQEGRGGRTDYRAALHWYGQAARQDLPQAIFHLGVMHMDGQGVPASHRRAAEFFERAALKGDRLCALNLGIILIEGQGDQPRDTASGLRWLQLAAERGHAYAHYALGRYYDEGKYLPANPGEAIKWYDKAARLGEADAQAGLVLVRIRHKAEQIDLGDSLRLLAQAHQTPGSAAVAQHTLAALCATYPEAGCRANGRFPAPSDKPLVVAWRPPVREPDVEP
jgi:TPR repeat protein